VYWSASPRLIFQIVRVDKVLGTPIPGTSRLLLYLPGCSPDLGSACAFGEFTPESRRPGRRSSRLSPPSWYLTDAQGPELAIAMAACRKHKATLVIAKLDRLSCNVAFIAALMDSGVEFVAVDSPHATRLTLHILAAVAEHEREMIAARTKAALQAVSPAGNNGRARAHILQWHRRQPAGCDMVCSERSKGHSLFDQVTAPFRWGIFLARNDPSVGERGAVARAGLES
jgi:Resolvase, N terminal domain